MKMLVVSNMFPDIQHPAYGIFVKKFCDELDVMQVDYEKSVMHKSNSKICKLWGYLMFYIRTFLLLLIRQYDIVYVHYASHSAAPVLLAKRFRKLTIYTNLHGSDVIPENTKQEKMQKYTRAILAVSSRIVVPSAYFKCVVQEKYAPECEVFIYPSAGINPDIFHPLSENERCAVRKKLGLPADKKLFGMAGRISHGKGWDTFVEAASLFAEETNVAFAIVGSGPDDKMLTAMLKEKGLHDRITRIGLLPQNELAEYYSSLDYFVFPTHRKGESLGLVALEAMACGCPVIASAIAAPNDYVIDGENGYRFQVSDADALAERLHWCMDVPLKDYKRMQNNAYKTAEAYYVQNIRNTFNEIFANEDNMN